jgi:DNA gyrase subunit A
VPEDAEELLLISKGGQVVRTDVKSVSRQSSSARGVKVMTMNEGDEVAGIAVFAAGDRESVEAGPSDEPPAE